MNITSRIEGIAEAGEVFFTESVYLSMNKNGIRIRRIKKDGGGQKEEK